MASALISKPLDSNTDTSHVTVLNILQSYVTTGLKCILFLTLRNTPSFLTLFVSQRNFQKYNLIRDVIELYLF